MTASTSSTDQAVPADWPSWVRLTALVGTLPFQLCERNATQRVSTIIGNHEFPSVISAPVIGTLLETLSLRLEKFRLRWQNSNLGNRREQN